MVKQLAGWRITLLTLLTLLCAEGVSRVAIIQRAFDPVDGSVNAARWRYYYVPSVPTVLLMGDSRMVIDLSPETVRKQVYRETGMSGFIVNIAMHGSSMEETYLMLSQVVLPRGRPQMIVLNVSEVALNDSYWDKDRPAYLRALQAPLSIDTWRDPQGRQAVFESLSGLVRLQHRIRLTVEDRWPNYWRRTETYDWGGSQWFGKLDALALEEQRELNRNSYLANYNPSGRQGYYFEKLLELAKANDYHLVVLISPVAPEFINLFSTLNDLQRFKQTVYRTAAQYHVPVIDYYQLPLLSSDMFFDLHHTNSEGTRVLSELVAHQIVVPALQDWEHFRGFLASPEVAMKD